MSDGSAARRLGGSAPRTTGEPALRLLVSAPIRAVEPPSRRAAAPPTCNRCGFPVHPAPWGCKNPCGNCGTIYPLGDCSD